MAARMDGHVTIIDRIVSADGPTLMPPGTFRPITIATIGGPLFMDPADLADPGRWAASLRTVRVHGDQEALRRLLMAGVKRGLLDDGGLIHADLRRLTAPILRDGRIVACLTVAGRPHRLADARLRRRAMRLLRAAADRLAIGASAGR
jgi:DNA-binding IclR family transcriptional regulator